jgi:hypothetical protein
MDSNINVAFNIIVKPQMILFNRMVDSDLLDSDMVNSLITRQLFI